MTIAACYLSPEGVVMGADSTASLSPGSGGFHFFNHNQKIFEIGENSTLAVLTWGLGGIGAESHRTLIADLAQDFEATPPSSVGEAAMRWAESAWRAYTGNFGNVITQLKALAARPPYDEDADPPAPDSRSKEEESAFRNAKLHFYVGFCIGGYVLPDRTPKAFAIDLDPIADQPEIHELPRGDWWFATPNVIHRLMRGADEVLRRDILTSPHWKGSESDLDTLLSQHHWQHPILPIRDAIDFVHTGIFSTIKAMKFSNFNQICGGPIEIGVITTDRRFRWVRHKDWDVAITEGMP